MSNPKRGEIWQVQLSISDMVGHEQKNDRPCIVLASDDNLTISTVIPLTGDPYAIRLPHTHKVVASVHTGLSTDSIALIHQIRSFDHKRFLRKLGSVGNKDMKTILALIANYLDISLEKT